MKISYIAHPVSGNIEYNLQEIKNIVRKINLTEPETVPFVPYYIDLIALNDNNPKERERGIKNDIAILKSGMVDEIRLYGSRISNGMFEEIKLAVELKIPVVPKTKETKIEFKKLFK
jgi:hypothetical protein